MFYLKREERREFWGMRNFRYLDLGAFTQSFVLIKILKNNKKSILKISIYKFKKRNNIDV